jgi:sec-independent protein translocase protein TatA
MFGKVEELVVVLIIILVLFGAKKLPQLSKGIADSVKEVRKGFRDDVSTTKQTGPEANHDQTKA